MHVIKKILLCFSILISKGAFSCRCATATLIEKYQRSDFVATIKILKHTKDENNANYCDIKFELVKLYKGESTSNLKIECTLNNSCSFIPPDNTTWLVFAPKNKNGILYFDYCSGNEQIDRTFDLIKYPGLDVMHKKSIEVKFELLDFIKENKITVENKFGLSVFDFKMDYNNLNGFNEENRVSIYELHINKDLSIRRIRILKRFKNRVLSKKLTDSMQKNLKISLGKVDSIPEKTRLIVAYFHYLTNKESTNFVSMLDL